MSFLQRLNNHQVLNPFQLFKYLVYFLLIRNIWIYYLEEQAAVAVMHAGGYVWTELINVYAATIDTFFWVVLLLLFELETWIIPDHKLTPPVKVSVTALRTICYASIVYAVYGYCVTYSELGDWQSVAGIDLCARTGQDFMYSIERFTTITIENCTTLAQGGELLGNGAAMVTDGYHFQLSWMLALANVVNATDWLLVVVILEVEIWLQTQGKLTARTLGTVTFIKIVLYGILGTIAVFWGVYGEFIDFWDAFLWIVAFIFIENNVVQWNRERRVQAIATA